MSVSARIDVATRNPGSPEWPCWAGERCIIAVAIAVSSLNSCIVAISHICGTPSHSCILYHSHDDRVGLGLTILSGIQSLTLIADRILEDS